MTNIDGDRGLVSICVPTYNRSNLIVNLLDSILSQTYKNLEVIITDNSENSDTLKVVQSRYQDKRIRYWKNETNLGMGGNTLKALSMISGEYFTFTPDDDVWIDPMKLEKQIRFLNQNPTINIIYTNAESIDYDGHVLDEFSSVYEHLEGNPIAVLNSTELLPGNITDYFLNILTPVIRRDVLLDVFRQSWYFESEEFFCYWLSASAQKIGFLYDKTVALREAEHYRTAVEDGVVVDWKKRKDIRIRQILGIYTTLSYLYPDTKKYLDTVKVHNFLAKHLLGCAKAAGSFPLTMFTLGACYLHFRHFRLRDVWRLQYKRGKSFG